MRCRDRSMPLPNRCGSRDAYQEIPCSSKSPAPGPEVARICRACPPAQRRLTWQLLTRQSWTRRPQLARSIERHDGRNCSLGLGLCQIELEGTGKAATMVQSRWRHKRATCQHSAAQYALLLGAAQDAAKVSHGGET